LKSVLPSPKGIEYEKEGPSLLREEEEEEEEDEDDEGVRTSSKRPG
jgi:hypothetical protein